MSRQNKVNPGQYTQAGRLSPDDMARERAAAAQIKRGATQADWPGGRTPADKARRDQAPQPANARGTTGTTDGVTPAAGNASGRAKTDGRAKTTGRAQTAVRARTADRATTAGASKKTGSARTAGAAKTGGTKTARTAGTAKTGGAKTASAKTAGRARTTGPRAIDRGR